MIPIFRVMAAPTAKSEPGFYFVKMSEKTCDLYVVDNGGKVVVLATGMPAEKIKSLKIK